MVALITACAGSPGHGHPSTHAASPGRGVTPESFPASDGRLASPSPTPCAPSSGTRALAGPVAAYYWSPSDSACVTVTLIDGSGQISTVTTPSINQYGGRFFCQDGNQTRPTPDSGLTPGPAYSVSNDRIYWWDGHLIHWLDRSGAQATEALDAGNQVGLEFAVSPDDTRMVITTIDFATWPLHRVTWVEDVGTHANRAVLFDANLSTDLSTTPGGGPAGWPWGWQNGRPVLFDFPLCVVLAGDQFFASHNPRIVDLSGNRLVTFPFCYGGSITSAGVFCTGSFNSRSLERYDWTGQQISTYQLPYDTLACDADPNPSNTRVLVYCQRNIYSAASPTRIPGGQEGPEFLFGAGPALPQKMQQPVYLRWLTDDLVLESRALSGQSENRTDVYVWSLSRQDVVAGPVDIPGWYGGSRQWFSQTAPPSRLMA